METPVSPVVLNDNRQEEFTLLNVICYSLFDKREICVSITLWEVLLGFSIVISISYVSISYRDNDRISFYLPSNFSVINDLYKKYCNN